MKCEFCSHENEEGVKFCGKCGAQVPDEPVKSENTAEAKADVKATAVSIINMVKAMPIQKLLKFIVPAVVLIVALIIVVPMLGGSNYLYAKDNISFFTSGDAIVVSGNNNSKFAIDGNLYSSQRSLDGSRAAVLTDYDYSTGGTLWFVTTSDRTRVADEVLSFKLSDTGRGIAYFTDYDSETDTAALFLYDTGSKRSSKITDEAILDRYEGYWLCISPDGKTVGYASDYENGEFTGYLKEDGKAAERLGRNMMAMAVSNGAKHLYYARASFEHDDWWWNMLVSFHVRSGRNDNRLMTDLHSLGSIRFILNNDYSQVIFNHDDRAFISRNGEERVRLTGSIYAFVTPKDTQERWLGGITVYGIKSFGNTLAVGNDGIIHINNRFDETTRVPRSSSQGYGAELSRDGRSLVFINNSGSLVRINPNRIDSDAVELSDENVRTFTASSDGNTVYFINRYNELWCVKGNGSPTKISDEVISNLAMQGTGKRLFFIADYSSRSGGDLYFTNNGGRRTKVTGDVMSVWNTPSNIFYLTSDSDLHRSNGGNRFSSFENDIGGMGW
jgi:hypothetical protein